MDTFEFVEGVAELVHGGFRLGLPLLDFGLDDDVLLEQVLQVFEVLQSSFCVFAVLFDGVDLEGGVGLVFGSVFRESCFEG